MDKRNIIIHEDWSDKAQGTSLSGYVNVDYNDLVELFGEPTMETDGYKVDAEWHVSFVDHVGEDVGFVTIYNYKDGKNYLGADGLRVGDIKSWHVGSKSFADVGHLENFLDSSMKPYNISRT